MEADFGNQLFFLCALILARERTHHRVLVPRRCCESGLRAVQKLHIRVSGHQAHKHNTQPYSDLLDIFARLETLADAEKRAFLAHHPPRLRVFREIQFGRTGEHFQQKSQPNQAISHWAGNHKPL